VWDDPKRSLALRAAAHVLRALMWFGVTMGSEPFYITAFPFIFWNVDIALGRRIIILWAMTMYIGQVCTALAW
jgi:hypothetical protein